MTKLTGRVLYFLLVLTAGVPHARAQAVTVAAGYEPPLIFMSPGQVVDLYVAGISDGRRGTAQGIPLPFELAGITVVVVQSEREMPVPMFSVEPVNERPEVTAITVQAPYEISTTALPGAFPNTELRIAIDGVPGPSAPVVAVADSVKVLERCEPPGVLGFAVFMFCRPMITHTDGSLVSETAPARPGEVLAIYAVGLGRPSQDVATGHSAQVAVPQDETLWLLDFSFGPNDSPRWFRTQASATPLFVGLVPGFVGLSQINFRVPELVPPDVPRCGDGVRSNLTISLSSNRSFDGGGICVEY
jgi:uncharacterized protein (TIGR03437 family)